MSEAGLDQFLLQLGATDTRKKLTVGTDIINYLGVASNSIQCEDVGQFIDGVVAWLSSSNFKVTQNGLEILGYLVDRMKEDFRPYLSTVLSAAADRLGDGKDSVREKTQALLMKLMENVVQPQFIFDKLCSAFTHKNGKVREEVMICLQKTLNTHGSQSLSLSKLVPCIVKLLSDPSGPVRDVAFNTLVEMYRHVGERVRLDLQKKHSVPPSKLPSLMAKFDEVRTSGRMMPTATLSVGTEGGRGDDEADRSVKLSAKSRASSAPPARRTLFAAPKPPAVAGTGPKVKRAPSLRRATSTSGQAGAVDEETFIRSFEDVPKVQLFSTRDLEEQLTKIRETISDPSNDWSKRIDSLKRLRSLLIAGAASFDELYPNLRLLEPPFQLTVKDLRSQVVREACITIAHLSQQLGQKLDHFSESLLPVLINLIPNGAKIMATSGIVAIRFIIQHTHAPRLIPIITSNLSSKSKDIRRACCEFLDQLLHTWPTHTLEKHIAVLQDAIRKGIADADPEARASGRKAFWGFADHFKEQSDSLLNSLDSSYKRLLHGELSMSNSSSNNSLNNSGKLSSISRSRASSAGGSTENLHRIPSITRRSGIPVLSNPKDTDGLSNGSPRHTPALRSNSAIDLQAAQRAKARAQYAASARIKVGSGASLPRPRKSSEGSPSISAITSPERVGRTRTRVSGVSQSQPSSRSGSPSSRLSYATYCPSESSTVGRTHRKSGIPRSTGTSRETSPNRFSCHDRSAAKVRTRTISSSSDHHRPPLTKRQPVMAQRILQQSREAESALADALNGHGSGSECGDAASLQDIDDFDCSFKGDWSKRPSNRKRYGTGSSFDDQSDDSETSSVCSERSLDSHRRPSDDVGDIISNCASTHWGDRKEGLIALQNFFQAGRMLSGSELKRVTEIFTKMFMDAHTKVFSLFLDTLNELVCCHKADLSEWLYVLLTRLLNKLGADLLGSVQTKINKTLEIVRESFPCDEQFYILMRFLVDQTQAPNTKVKVALLNYLRNLSAMMLPGDFNTNRDTEMAIAKIITWTTEPKSAEIRKASQACVIALFNLNTPEFTMLLAQLPKVYQDSAAQLVQNHLRRNSADGSPGSLKSPPSPVTPRLHSPSTSLPRSARSNRSNTLDMDETENLNAEEVYKSLRRTTAEIQNYSFDSLELSKDRQGKLERDLSSQDRDTTSQDSGISQMSAGAGEKLDTLEERMEDLSINNSGSGRSSSLSSPTHRLNSGSPGKFNGFDRQAILEATFDGESEFFRDGQADDVQLIQSVISELGNIKTLSRTAERKGAMTVLIKLVHDGNINVLIENFRTVLRVLLENLKDDDGSVRALVYAVLTEMLRKETLAQHFQSYTELIILKVLEAHKDSSKDVVRAAEACAATMATVLPSDMVIRVLNPIIRTGDFPVNAAAIKMLTKLIEQQDRTVVESWLNEIMPGLIKAYDNVESSVRKASVFCMVALHSTVGEEPMKPHLEPLNGSKMKLLNLYIKRAQSQTSTPSSPKSTPP